VSIPLRFGLFTTFYPPYHFGGDAVDVERFARALAARGHHVTVVHEVDGYRWLAGDTVRPAEGGDEAVEVVRLRSRAGVLSTILTHQLGRPVLHRAALARLCRERRFDVIVFNNVSLIGGPGLFSFGGDALRVYLAHEHWLVCPTHVLWRHDREPCTGRQCLRCLVHYRRPPQLWRYTGYLRRQMRHVDVFLARSEFSRDKHREFGFPRPMDVLPNFLPAPPKIQDAPDGPSPHPRPYFLFAGRLERIKGLDTILPAMARYPDADLLVAGDGGQLPALRALAAGNPRVTFLGWVPGAELARYYRHAVALIVPSVGFETFGLVLVEAFQYGTPVIARRIGPFPGIIERSGAGELFSTTDELVDAMRRLQHDPRRRDDLGRRGRLAWREAWSEDAIIGRFFEILARAGRARAAARGLPPPAWLPEAT